MVTALERLDNADRLWRKNGGAVDYTIKDLASAQLLPNLLIDDTMKARYPGLPFTFELQQAPTAFKVAVYEEAKAHQIVAKLGARARYLVEGTAHVVEHRPQHPPPLAPLLADHAMHISVANTNQLRHLRFNEGAQVTIGTTCGLRDGKWHGGIAVDKATLKLAVCKRVDIASSRPDRTWHLAETPSISPPKPKQPVAKQDFFCGDLTTPYTTSCCACTALEQRKVVPRIGQADAVLVSCASQPSCGDGTPVCDQTKDCKQCANGTNVHATKQCPNATTCGDGTTVQDPATDCKYCWDGTNISVGAVCPEMPAIDRCDDGTPVLSLTQCRTCWHGTVGPSTDCLAQETCGDGTVVVDRANDCKTCPNGLEVSASKTCPVLVDCACGGNAATLDACPPLIKKSCPNGCPSVCPNEICATPVETGPESCPSGFSMLTTSSACAIERRCIQADEPCPCEGVRGSDGQCPSIVKTVHSATCPAGYEKRSVESACAIQESCIKTCPCGGGLVTLPQDCPPLTMKGCESGCPDVCPTESCATPTRTGPASCSTGYSLVETQGSCTVDGICVRDLDPCPCGAEREDDGMCAAIEKVRVSKVCESGYSKIEIESQCTITEECVQDCPCNGAQVTQPSTCPPLVKPRTPATCADGYTKVETETACAITESCVRVCPCTQTSVTFPQTCPAVVKQELGPASCAAGYDRTLITDTECASTFACEATCPCGNGTVRYPDACPTVVKAELGSATCPIGYERVLQTEDACSITYGCEQKCPCTNTTAVYPSSCAAVIKNEIGPQSCVAGYSRVVVAETACSIAYACEFLCPNGQRVSNSSACPKQACPCNQPSVMVGEACPPFHKTITGDTSCPASADFSWYTVKEDQCYEQRQCLCTGSPQVCWSGPEACFNPVNVAIVDVNGTLQRGYICDRESDYY